MPEIVDIRSMLPLENLLTGMALESEESLLVLENDGGRISRVVFNDTYETIGVETLHEGLIDPVALLRMEDDSLLVAERAAGRVIRLHDGVREVLMEGLDEPSSVRMGDTGEIIVVEMGSGRVLSYNLQTRRKTVVNEDRLFPSDALQIRNTLVVSELFERQRIGQVARVPISRSILATRFAWVNDQIIIDPTRLTLDPVRLNTVLVSVRQLNSNLLLDEPRSGAVLRLHLVNGRQIEVVMDDLISPTDVVAVPNGFFVMEERTERIHFISRRGERHTIWKGLGEPPAFSLHPRMEGAVIVAESLPQPALIQVDSMGNRSVFFDEFEFELDDAKANIGGVLSDHRQTYVSFRDIGRIDRIALNNRSEVFSHEVFSPGKLLRGNGDTLWVLDRLMNEIVVLQMHDAQILNRIRTSNFHLTDFQLSVESDGEEYLFVMDSSRNIYRYQASRGAFQLLVTFPPSKRSILNNVSVAPVFARVARTPGNGGFIAALNDAAGSLYWANENGELVHLMDGFKDVNQLIYKAEEEELVVLSKRGWVRTIALEFNDEVVMPQFPPTSLFMLQTTSISEWNLHEN